MQASASPSIETLFNQIYAAALEESEKRPREEEQSPTVEKRRGIEGNVEQILESFLLDDGSIYLKQVIKTGAIRERILGPTNSIYEGECQDKKPHGQGRFQLDQISVVGQFEHGQVKCGRVFKKNVLIYDGEFQNGKRHGNGTLFEKNFRKEGLFENDQFIKGKITKLQYGEIFEGALLEGRYHGQGILTKGNMIYEGQFEKGVFIRGKSTDKLTGDVYEGRFYYWVLQGPGKLTTKTYVLEGKFEFGEIEYGKRTDASGEYKGFLCRGEKHGKGTLTQLDGQKITGQWENGKLLLE